MNKQLVVVFLIVLFPLSVWADGILLSWGMKDIKGMTKERFDVSKTWTVEEVLQKNLQVKTWADAYLVAVGASAKKDIIVDQLIEQIANATTTKLELTNRLIIWERILTNDIFFEGKGYQVNDDLFSVAGRANWVLRTITQKTFGYVKPNMSIDEIQALQVKWKEWRKGLSVPEYINPYETKEKGLSEIHSMIAFEALIYALKPSEVKDAITKDCLKRVYNLTEMPEDKKSSAMFCNPDNYTLMYLGQLINDKKADETKTYEWWRNWWEQNKNKLVWNAEKGFFQLVT